MSRDVRISDVFDNIPVTIGDSGSVDAFGGLRVSEKYGIYDYKQISTNNVNQFEELVSGAGTSTYQYDRSSTYLTVGTASGDRVVRQSIRYLAYVPGKGQLIIATCVFGQGKDNVDQYVGYGDDLNGLFFKMQGTELGVVLRSSVGGSPVDIFYGRTAAITDNGWNIDRLDGSGPSKIRIDITKAHIFVIDFQWLGVGRIRFGLDIDGIFVPVHQILNANNISSVYMKTPTLPIRYEVVNTGVTSSSTTLEQICSSVASEGGYSLPGLEFSVSNGVTRRAISTRAPVLAVRLKANYPAGEPNRKTAKYQRIEANATSNDAFIEMVHIHNPSAITATWNPVSVDSALEYSTNITSITGNPAHVVDATTAVAGIGSSSGRTDVASEFINLHSFISQNYDSTNSQVFVVYATAYASTSNVSCVLTMIEFD